MLAAGAAQQADHRMQMTLPGVLQCVHGLECWPADTRLAADSLAVLWSTADAPVASASRTATVWCGCSSLAWPRACRISAWYPPTAALQAAAEPATIMLNF